MNIKLALCLLVAAPITCFAQAYTYPSTVYDTSLHPNPFYHTVAETSTVAIGNRNIAIHTESSQNSTTEFLAVLNPSDLVPGLQLTNGSLELVGSGGLVGASRKLPTVNGVIRQALYFTNTVDQTWRLVNVGSDGLYGLFTTNEEQATYNGFAICNTAVDYFYSLEMQSSSDNSAAPGCERIALHTFLGPPFS